MTFCINHFPGRSGVHSVRPGSEFHLSALRSGPFAAALHVPKKSMEIVGNVREVVGGQND